METPQNFFKTAYLGIATKIISAGLGVILSITLARLLGASDYGVYILYINIINTIVVLILLGLPQLVTREVAKKFNINGERVDKSIYLISLKKILLSSLALFAISIGYTLTGFTEASIVVSIFIIVVTTALTQLNASVIRGSHKPVKADLPNLLVKPTFLLLFLLLLYFLNKKIEIHMVLTSILMATAIAFVISLLNIRKLKFIQSREANFLGIKYFYVIAIVVLFETQIPIYTLSLLDTNQSVAYYQIGLQLASLIIFVILSINNQLSPKLSEAFQDKNKKYLQNILDKSLKFSFLYIVIASLVTLTILFNVGLIYGDEYEAVFHVSLIILVTQISNVLLGSSALVMSMSGNQRVTLKIMLLSMAVNLMGCLVLIPIYSYYGAAISALAAMVIWKSVLSYLCYKKFGVKTYFRIKVLKC